MPDVAWNTETWGHSYKWPAGGEDWSQPWGGSEAQWFGSLYPRLHRLIPARRILEIAPGFGRWTRFLVPACETYLGIDLAEACVVECRRRFAAASHARFVANDGYSLQHAQDGAFDLIFSFDSLVHADRDVLESYVPQMLRKLAPGGAVFIHHSNLAAIIGPDGVRPDGLAENGRSRTVSAAIVADTIDAAGGRVLVQEAVNWVFNMALTDVFTTFGRVQDFPDHVPVHLANPRYMDEAEMILGFQSPYAQLPNLSAR
jgi:SAM-dependent methyltransferase